MHKLIFFLAALLLVSAIGCVRNQPDVIVITATFQAQPDGGISAAGVPTSAPPIQQTLFAQQPPVGQPTPDPTRPGVSATSGAQEYIVQPGDTLTGIALAHGVSIETLLSVNTLTNPDALEVGQVIRLPGAPSETTSDFKILPDSKLVLGPGSLGFDIDGFIASQPGYIRTATDLVDGELLSAAQVVKRVALEYSIDPRVLLTVLEIKGEWLTNPAPSTEQQAYPVGIGDSEFGFSRSGLYRQLSWAANQLNYGYYGWKYNGISNLELPDGIRLQYAPGLNAGTVALQYMLSQVTPYILWVEQIGAAGFYQTYTTYFGNPFAGVIDPLVPEGIQQPPLALPFPQGQTWFFTGGPHGGWGAGSAWSAIDFAPPDDLTGKTSGCYISDYFATAMAPGVIARTDVGTVILDLDGDGDETTGWTILYLHIAEQDRIAQGTTVQIGDRIGRPSCEGGFSNGTHMHIARRYNGEWIPADCTQCPPGQSRPAFVMDDWTMVGLPGQEYQGYMVKGNERRIAEQGRNTTENRVSW